MVKKYALIGTVFFMLMIGVVAFALPSVNVTVNSSTVTVKTKIYTYVVNVKTGLLEKGYLAFKRDQLFWVYGGDGFDLYASNTKLIPTSWNVNGKENSFETQSDVSVNFFYTYNGQQIKKTITFVNGPNYEVKVSVNGPKGLKMRMNFPALMSDFNKIRDNGKLFATYSSGYKNIIVAKVKNGKFENDGSVEFTSTTEALAYLGPVKNTEIFTLFPKDVTVISEILKDYPGSEPWYGWFLYLFVKILDWIYSWSGNYGWAIIIFAVLVRLSIYPLSHAQMKSMVQMRKLQPKVKEIQKKYKDPKKQQEELMKLYKSEGANPASGCLLSLVQLPVLFLLYYVIIYSKEAFAYNGQFLMWNDLSIGGFQANFILVVLIILLTAWSTLWTSTNAKQAWQSIAMFTVMEFLFVGFPVGLFLYYTTFSAMQLLTTYVVAKMYHIQGISVRELFGMNPKRKYGRR
ncbi:membrane protein insertase YidC [Mesoaciditoga lauensis]|uniref:membrane protein insertase YidC n=1 Tax=Mesoaciditoga lauensis TaxID=1495039 RepID=UPI00068ABE52|nr:membrane protein insertase YidC [Mesoaciditoga lauensis]